MATDYGAIARSEISYRTYVLKYLDSLSGASFSEASAVDLSTTDALYDPAITSIYVGGAGNVKVDVAGGGTGIVFTAVPVGTYLRGSFTKIYRTGTTATNLVATR